MLYGVLFGDKHSYNDWKLIPKSRPDISPPNPKTMYIDVPEADGKLDLTESLSGEVRFENRKITCDYTVLETRDRWTSLYSEILNYLHGQKLRVIFDEDPNHYYLGRFTVNSWKSSKRTSTIVIEGDVDPYKYDLSGSLEDWEWDTFNFETDYIREYWDLSVDGSLDFIVYGSRMHSVPSFIVDSDNGTGMQVVFESETYNLQDGRNRVINIVIKEGANELTFVGQGTVSIDYHGGSL